MVTFEKMSDEQLIQLYVGGNNKAFETLLLRHKNYIYTHIYSLIKDQDISNDIFQDTFIRIITQLQQKNYAETGKFKYWALRIAHNMVIDYLRAKNTDAINVDPADFSFLPTEHKLDGNCEEWMIKKQSHQQVRWLCAQLPEDQRQIVQMRFYENLSFKEIAELTGVSINTSLGRMRYALINMRKMAKEYNISLT